MGKMIFALLSASEMANAMRTSKNRKRWGDGCFSYLPVSTGIVKTSRTGSPPLFQHPGFPAYWGPGEADNREVVQQRPPAEIDGTLWELKDPTLILQGG